MNMTAENNVLIRFAQEGIQTPDAIEATKQDILTSMPAEIAAAMAELPDIEKVEKYMEAYFLAKKGAAPETNPAEKKTSQPAASAVSAEEALSIQNYYDLNAEKMEQRASKSRVVCLLTDKPVLAAIHVQGAKLIPTVGENTEASFNKYKDQLVDTPENKQAYKELKEAFMKREPMEVYVNPAAKEKVIGYKVETLDDNNAPVTLCMTKDDARDFLLTKVQGVIPANSESSVGISIKFITRKNNAASDNEANASNKGTVRVALQNSKALKDNPQLTVCSCAILEVGGKRQENDQFTAKTDKYFTIYTGKQNKEGNPITRKVRMSGKTTVYVVERLQDYVATFGPAVRTKGFGMTQKERNKARENCIKAMAYLSGNMSVVESSALRTAVAQIRRGQGTASANDFS